MATTPKYPKTIPAAPWNFDIIEAKKMGENVVHVTFTLTKEGVAGQAVFDYYHNLESKDGSLEPADEPTEDLQDHLGDDVQDLYADMKHAIHTHVIRSGPYTSVRLEWISGEIQPHGPPADEGLCSPVSHPNEVPFTSGMKLRYFKATICGDDVVVVEGEVTNEDLTGKVVFKYTYSRSSKEQSITFNRDLSYGGILKLLDTNEDARKHLMGVINEESIKKSEHNPATPEKSEDLVTEEGAETATPKRPTPCESGDAPAAKKANTSHGDKTEPPTGGNVIPAIDTPERTDDVGTDVEAEEEADQTPPRRTTRSTAINAHSTKKDKNGEKDKSDEKPKTGKSLKQSLRNKVYWKNDEIEKAKLRRSNADADGVKRADKLRDYAEQYDGIDAIMTHIAALRDLKQTTMSKDCRREIVDFLSEISEEYDSDEYDQLIKERDALWAQYMDAQHKEYLEMPGN